MSRRRPYGCLGLAGTAFLLALVFLGSGLLCIRQHGNFDCIGLLTVFPIASLLVAGIALAVGMQHLRESSEQRPLSHVALGQEVDLEPLGPDIGEEDEP